MDGSRNRLERVTRVTLERLNELFELREKLSRAMETRLSLESAACPGAQVLTGMPHTTGVKDKVGDLAVELADLSARIDYLQGEVTAKEKEIEDFVSSIDDDQTRIIFRLRFFRALSWKEVAFIMGRDYSEKSVSEACYKYLNRVDSGGQ